MLDPFAGSAKDDNGTIVYNVSQDEMDKFFPTTDDQLREKYEHLKSKSEVWEIDEEEEDSFRMALQEELATSSAGLNIEDFNKVLEEEFNVFQKGEKYDYVKDLKGAFKNSMKLTSEQKIFATIPDFVFWDIKKPMNKKFTIKGNRYNPFRGDEHTSFFDMRDQESYMDMQELKLNRNNSVSLHAKY